MRIGIDARTISEKGGCRTYLLNLIENLLKIDCDNHYVIFYNSKNFLGKFKDAEEYVVKPGQKSLQLVYDHISVPSKVKKYKLDLIHTPKSATSLFYRNIKNVVTVLDMIPLKFPNSERLPNRIYWKIQLPIAIKKADIIITISKSSKEDIIRMFKVPENKVRVIYLGHRKEMKPLDRENIGIKRIKEKYLLPDKFILFVGTIQPRKNLDKVFKAFALLKKRGKLKDHRLVVCGRLGWLYKPTMNLINELDIQEDIKILDFVPDEDLPYIYNLANLFVFPSQYEGFGLPVLEAMACGVPVITSNKSSLPEIIGEVGIMIEPEDIQSLADNINKVLDDEDLREEMIKKGLKQAKKFSWDKCARETLEVYKSLL